MPTYLRKISIAPPPGSASRSYKDRADAACTAWKALLASFLLAVPCLGRELFLPGRRSRQTLWGLVGLRARVGKVYLSRGKDVASKSIKEDLNALKLSGMEGTRYSPKGGIGLDKFLRGYLNPESYTGGRRVQFCVQIGRASRALPFPSEKLVNEAKADHLATLTSEFECLSSDLRSARVFAQTFVTRNFPKASHRYYPSLSACLENTRSEGGLLEQLRTMSERYQDEIVTLDQAISEREGYPPLEGLLQWVIPYTGNGLDAIKLRNGKARRGDVMFGWDKSYVDMGQSLDSWEMERVHLFIAAACVKDMRDNPHILAEQVPVRERGCKVRMVTKTHASLIYLGHLVSAPILECVKREPSTGVCFRSKHEIEDFAKLFNQFGPQSGDWVFRSADLKAATDLMPRDLLESLTAGCLLGLGVSPGSMSWRLGMRLVGTFCVSGKLTRRGAFMGSPLSWPLLSIYNAWMHERSWTETYPDEDNVHRGTCVIAGDDYLAYIPRKVSERYTQILRRTGGQESVGKDYTVTSTAYFGEEVAAMKNGRLVPLKTWSVRCLTGTDEWQRSRAPEWMIIPPSVFEMASELSGRVKRHFIRVTRIFLNPLAQWFRKIGIPPYLPREYGGGGLPHSHPSRAIRPWKSWCRALRIELSKTVQGQTPFGPAFDAQRCWAREHRFPTTPDYFDIVRESKEMVLAVASETGWVGEDCEGSVYAADAAISIQTFFAPELVWGVGSKGIWPGLSTVASKLRSWVKETNRSVPRGRLEDETVDLIKGLRNGSDKCRNTFRVRTPPFSENQPIGGAVGSIMGQHGNAPSFRREWI